MHSHGPGHLFYSRQVFHPTTGDPMPLPRDRRKIADNKNHRKEPLKQKYDDFSRCAALGFDTGSLFTKIVGIDNRQQVVFHEKIKSPDADARIASVMQEAVRHSIKTGVTAGCGPDSFKEQKVDPVRCLVEYLRVYYPGIRYMLEIGASHYTFIELDSKGNLCNLTMNSPCASGTGLFLDSQAERLGIDPEGECTELLPPRIASHCAVFAQSDLIHRQQEGFTAQAMWSGLCRGFTDHLLNTILIRQSYRGTIGLCGGVALNRTVQYWFRFLIHERKPDLTVQPLDLPDYAVVSGAALLALRPHCPPPAVRVCIESAEPGSKRPALTLKKSVYPDALKHALTTLHDGNEIRIHKTDIGSRQETGVFLGVDIGSVSTKAAVIDTQGRLLMDLYRRTAGNPIEAAQKLFQEIGHLCHAYSFDFHVRRAAVTGSGRKLIGALIGADFVINEITAHARASVEVDPEVETVFEIGGQDAKLISIKNGRVSDARLNDVCAAGTGAFIEALAGRLGYTVNEIGKRALGVRPPYTSSRCTVFMDQDIQRLMQEGCQRREAAGAVMYSICDNYLERVVGLRPISHKRILFQGATARNPALVAAFEQILNIPMVVPEPCHVMGAYGAALLVKERTVSTAPSFKGFDLADEQIYVTHEPCDICSAKCQLTRIHMKENGTSLLWGMKCGRNAEARRKHIPRTYRPFLRAQRQLIRPVSRKHPEDCAGSYSVVMPRVFTSVSHFHFWNTFFHSLGLHFSPGPETDTAMIQEGRGLMQPDFCLPMKAAAGHVNRCFTQFGNALIFMPHMLADARVEGLSNTRYCPYISIFPSLIKKALSDSGRIVAPVIDFSLSDRLNAEAMAKAFSPFIRFRSKRLVKAFEQARAAGASKLNHIRQSGSHTLETLRKPVCVIVGNPYVISDSVLSKDLPFFIAGSGIDVIPYFSLPFKPGLLTGEFRNMYWSYGQHLLSALIQIMQTDGLYAVFLSSFGCGPNSLLLTYAETIMKKKPFLVLELDEHSSIGGYQTRIEAFLEVVKQDRTLKTSHAQSWHPPRETASGEDLKKRTVWIPPMHTIGNRLFAATFLSQNYHACTLPPEDEQSYSMGRKWMRGSECLPTPLIFGTFIRQLSTLKARGGTPDQKNALFMPTADGPCRFGQYRTLERILLDRMGYDCVPVLSPGAHNGYYGLNSRLRLGLWKAVIIADILFEMGCRIRPYEAQSGETDAVLEHWIHKAETRIRKGMDHWPAFVGQAAQEFCKISVRPKPCPLVGVVGEIYVRFNEFANHHLVKTIETMGGEVWISPISEWILYTIWNEYDRARRRGGPMGQKFKLAVKWKYLDKIRSNLYRAAAPVFRDKMTPATARIVQKGTQYVPVDFEGESLMTLGRALVFIEDGADLVVNCSSFGCMHGNVTAALFDQMREDPGVPVVNALYDGFAQDRTVISLFSDIRNRTRRLNYS